MSERKTLLYNLSLFGLTSVLFVAYSVIFARHIYNGLSSDLLDELVWLTALCAAVFHAQAVYASYQTYLQSQGGSLPPLTVGPFTILPNITRQANTPVLPSASGRNWSGESDERAYDRLMTATPDLEEEDAGYPTDSSIIISPPTPSSVRGSNLSPSSSPNLQTPSADEFINHRTRRESGDTPTRPGALRKISGDWFGRRKSSEDDVERGHEMVGLGMGSLVPNSIRA
ncbi:hypothetical protein NliqN6_2426 [Naganishia liquefaciens]|uniref:Uncharacterized protein n=1 Tax=Naganishia liquefaciens TaxID=104408 RepID=A0A8H3TS67_9TREE|nr:hypothetical protein NliqN6_2426 [Naganishia liquefaciens]